MLNSASKKKALSLYKTQETSYRSRRKSIIETSQILFDVRLKMLSYIEMSETIINNIANTPKTFDKQIKEININYKNFNQFLDDMGEYTTEKVGGSIAGAGVAVGVGVAAFGSTAAMSIATTFGVASTGTAISTLSGAAATNAALAWLGGGALTAGGSGITAGSALLALAGPVGWSIGGVAFLGGGLYTNSKNKKIAEEALEKTKELKGLNAELRLVMKDLYPLKDSTITLNEGLLPIIEQASLLERRDYATLTEDEKALLGSLVNNTLAASILLNKTVGK
ncbi:hypothetical protein [uncultured Vagococcus sp.]|uniref:hypothetical protein n=1 Tax=uncultured Vagococcus sp. TaxID=189676 RepID=UPI0028D84009|nr:hypothetical protein [uncultured Vagococcus sp.]